MNAEVLLPINSMTLPTIDLSAFDDNPQAIAHQIDHACRTVGFFYLTGHNLPPLLLAQMFAQSQAFFQLPLNEKCQSRWTHAQSNRGYSVLGQEQLNPYGSVDYKEALNLGHESPTTPNPWPQKLPGFRETALACFDGFAAIAHQLFQGLAIALDLPLNFFVERHNQNPFTLRLLHYPPIAEPLADAQLRAGEHSDYGTITLLAQDDMGGLEIQTVDGDWLAVPPRPDTVLVNLGDLLARWTNQVYRSTPHRVELPEGDRTQQSRYSIAFFCDANPDTEVACLPSCQQDRPPLYPPIRAGDYLLSRLNATYRN